MPQFRWAEVPDAQVSSKDLLHEGRPSPSPQISNGRSSLGRVARIYFCSWTSARISDVMGRIGGRQLGYDAGSYNAVTKVTFYRFAFSSAMAILLVSIWGEGCMPFGYPNCQCRRASDRVRIKITSGMDAPAWNPPEECAVHGLMSDA